MALAMKRQAGIRAPSIRHTLGIKHQSIANEASSIEHYASGIRALSIRHALSIKHQGIGNEASSIEH